MFTKEYWSSSWKKLKSVKFLSVMGFMIALKVILNNFRVPVADNLNIMFTYIPGAIEAMIVGPAAAMISGAITDIIGVMTSGFGPFFPGYTLSKILSGLIYGLGLYRAKPTFLRLFATKACINYLINVLLGSLWSSMMYSQSFIYYASASVVKNTILLPVEVVILYAVLHYLYPLLKRKGFISEPPVQESSSAKASE